MLRPLTDVKAFGETELHQHLQKHLQKPGQQDHAPGCRNAAALTTGPEYLRLHGDQFPVNFGQLGFK